MKVVTLMLCLHWDFLWSGLLFPVYLLLLLAGPIIGFMVSGYFDSNGLLFF